MKIRELTAQIAAFRKRYPNARKRTDGQKAELQRLTDARSAAKLTASEFSHLKSALKLYQEDISEAEAQTYRGM